MKSEITLRAMVSSDLLFADSLRELAGWNQMIDDWKRWLALSPEGCFLAEWNDSPAGTATTVCYGAELGWIGMLLVHPDFRGRGIGRALLTRCLDYLRGRGISCMKLDATREGRLLYDQLGFEEEWPLTRWKRSGLRLPASAQSNEIRPHAPSDARGIESLDRAAFGVARPAILQSLLGGCCQALVHETFEGIAGYGAMREGSHSNHLGPLVAATARSGALLAQALLAGSGNETVYWDIPDPNVDAIDLAKSLGFAAERHWMRMFLGLNKHPGTVRQYFAIADPAVG